MAFKLIKSAQACWCAVNAPHLVALVRAGARFERGFSSSAREPRGMIPAIGIIDAFPVRRGADAAILVFEYMAAALAEAGHPAPASPAELPGVLGCELENLQAAYRPPGPCSSPTTTSQPPAGVRAGLSAGKGCEHDGLLMPGSGRAFRPCQQVPPAGRGRAAADYPFRAAAAAGSPAASYPEAGYRAAITDRD